VLSDDKIEELRGRVTAAVAHACPGWFAGHREDIVQHALVRLIGTLERSGRNPDLSPMYLMKAAHGAAVDEIRKWCRGNPMLALDEASLERKSSGQPDPERECASAEIGLAIQQCLAGLLGSRLPAVTLYLQGCTVPETSRRLGWTLGKTEKLVYRGLDDLRRCLRRKGVEP
jgi:RNA polymerase sigma-70 factor (ECF subfamily)